MKKIETRASNKSKRVYTLNTEPSRTQRQFRSQVDVNNIMKRYIKTGQITHLNNRSGKYADISSAQDYFESMKTISSATQAFQQLPSHLRKRFGNDPSLLLEFIHDPKNYDEGVKLGIFDHKQPPLETQISTPPPLSKNDDLNDDKLSTSPAPKKPK